MSTLEYEKKSKSYKMLLLFAMISIFMIFAGLTSAFVVSKQRPDWISNLVLPNSFSISTTLIVVSSLTYFLAKKAMKKGEYKQTMSFLILTLALGLGFVYFQYQGFFDLFNMGLVPTGPSGKVTVSFLYAFVIMHVLHLFGGIFWLGIVIYNHFKQKYNPSQMLGIELNAMYWHFMDFIWVYLFFFFYFYK